ncbi:hypothetical protein PTTG_27052 [Puccinia triticina 1-1 BBBD Race 1]|uniref:Uncharacterized protein n=1 Tax=Puccinia triticina (isolate 1-1 / race 1 (BBBD)) TaxID=630390 RepID=A0A180GND1_PUCT1|nr:hypothetical protein PTTG_27052 [Puccinia triticina 1-1 BBBD Race 1]
MHIISLSYREGNKHFTFQTQWMAERLLARLEEGNKLYSGGLLSNVTYQFFDNGYLLTTSMYCNQINRWIPVQLSWIRGLTKRYYQTHFAVLFKQFITPSILQEERDQLLRSVVDFSSAQQNGFIAACIEVFNVSNKAAIIIMADKVKIFETLCHNLLLSNAEAGKTHEERIDEIRHRFPKVKKWLDWWTMADVEATLFPSQRAMLEDSPNGDDGLPNTTNTQESMHRVYYMFSAGKKHLFYGMVELYGFVKALEKDYNLVMRGMPIEYGNRPRKQIDISESIGWKKPTKRQRAAFLNNGRAPNTTDKLVSKHPDKRAKVNQINPASFVPGKFSLVDRFMEMCIETSSNSSKVLPSLFQVHESREFSCPTHPEADQKQHPRAERTLDGLKITREMFKHNHLQPANVTELFTRWTTNGLSGITGLQCQVCNVDDNKRKTKKKAPINTTPTRYMHEKSTLSWENNKAPLHLYTTGRLFGKG